VTRSPFGVVGGGGEQWGADRGLLRADDRSSAHAGHREPPELTRRERYVLAALCRPALESDVFTEPASVRQIAEALVVTEAAVKQHLMHLYDKFAIPETGERRRVRLAREAVRLGVVSIADAGVAGARLADRPDDALRAGREAFARRSGRPRSGSCRRRARRRRSARTTSSGSQSARCGPTATTSRSRRISARTRSICAPGMCTGRPSWRSCC
jgi:hypothetical protein